MTVSSNSVGVFISGVDYMTLLKDICALLSLILFGLGLPGLFSVVRVFMS